MSPLSHTGRKAYGFSSTQQNLLKRVRDDKTSSNNLNLETFYSHLDCEKTILFHFNISIKWGKFSLTTRSVNSISQFSVFPFWKIMLFPRGGSPLINYCTRPANTVKQKSGKSSIVFEKFGYSCITMSKEHYTQKK